MKPLALGASLGLMLFFVGCQKENPIDQNEQMQGKFLSAEVIQKITNLGLNGKTAVDMGDYYLVEGDIMVTKSALNAGNSQKSLLKQAQWSSLVTMYNVQRITLYVDPSIPTSGSDNWREAVQAAISEWNSTNSSIRMSYTTNPSADIIISSDKGSLGNNVLAQGSWPDGYKPGKTIIINLDFLSDYQMSASQKKYNVVHELGHCVGLRHTNWYGSEPTGTTIPNTPNSGSNPDPNSVMNGGTALNSWNGFSNYDLIAFSTLYPTNYFKASISGPGSHYIGRTCNYSASVVTGVGISGTLSYEWYFKENNEEDDTSDEGWDLISTTDRASFQLTCLYSYIKLIVRNSNGEVSTAQKRVVNKGEEP